LATQNPSISNQPLASHKVFKDIIEEALKALKRLAEVQKKICCQQSEVCPNFPPMMKADIHTSTVEEIALSLNVFLDLSTSRSFHSGTTP
jgi:hypothetical protein